MTREIDDNLALSLVGRCASREEKALEALHKLLVPLIYRFALRKLRSEHDAETVVIDTMYEVWQSAGSFRGDSLVSTWVLGIARFKLLTLLRKAAPPGEDIADFEDILVGDSNDGEAALIDKEEEQQIQRCMSRLSATHRECVQLVYYLGLGLVEVAQRLHVPEGTVKSRLSEARKSLRDCLLKAGAGPHRL